MKASKPTLTPFELAEQRRIEGLKRLAGFLAISSYQERLKCLRASRTKMTLVERKQWHQIIDLAITKHHEHFGCEA